MSVRRAAAVPTASSTADQQISELSRELAQLGSQWRALRDEVSMLEQTQHANRMMHRAAEHRELMVASGDDRDGDGAAYTQSETVQEFVDEMASAVARVRIALTETERLQAERKDCTEGLERCQGTQQQAQAELNQMYEVLKWRPGASHSRECPVTLTDESAQLKKKILDAHADRQAAVQRVVDQETTMRRLAAEIISYQSLEATLAEGAVEIEVEEGRLRSIDDEINSMRRLLARKDKMLTDNAKTSSTRTSTQLKDLEANKRVAQKKLVGHQEIVRQNDVAIRHRALTIAKLLEKMELIGDALGGTDSSDVPRVEAVILEELQSETAVLSKEEKECQRRLGELDRDMETMEGRVLTLEKAIGQAEAGEKRQRKEHEKYLVAVEEQLAIQRVEASKILAELEDQIAALRSEVHPSSSSEPQQQQNEDLEAVELEDAAEVPSEDAASV